MKYYIQTFNKYLYLLFNLISRDFKIKYRRSILGILWSILNPVLMMVVITAVFLNLFKFEIDNFPIYYLTGSTIFSFFTDATTSSMTSIVGSGQIIKKVYIPKYIFPLQKCLFSFVNLFFSLIALIIMIIILKFEVTYTVILAPIPIIYILIFSLGISLILSSLTVFFRDIVHLYGVITTIWMYFTPIIYPENILSDSMLKLISLNPLYHYVGYFRDVVMYGKIPSLKVNIICICFSLITLIIGSIIFKRTQDKFVLHI
ncbi:MAG: ABC transporter permease [Oscillospiraceae bacterium]|nr:ABC transporter permease [Oscillospiraceae bacterium]